MPRKTGMSLKLSNQGKDYPEKLHGVAIPADVPMDVFKLVADVRALSEKRHETKAIGETDAAAVHRLDNLRAEALADTRDKFSARAWQALQERDSNFFDDVSKAIKSKAPSILHTLILRVVEINGTKAVETFTASRMREEIKRLFVHRDGKTPRHDFNTRKIADACRSLGVSLKGKATD